MADQPGLEEQPLADMRVIDLTHGISGPYCTKMLADFGANVVKVERPTGGDYARRLGPFPGDQPDPEKSGMFLHVNANKRGVTLDLKTAGGKRALEDLLEGADVLTESFRPGTMARLGLDYETLSRRHPGLIMTSFSNFGQTGPYRDYKASELVFYAMGGRMNTTGQPDRHPIKLGGNHVQYQAGNVGAMATMFAFYARQYGETGGQHIDISIFESQMASMNARLSSLVQYQYTGERGKRLGGGGAGGYPAGFYPCQDGYVNVQGGGAFWPRTVALLGIPELLEDPRYAPPLGQLSPEGKEEFEGTYWFPWLMTRTKRQVVEECQSHEILSGMVNTIDEVVDDNPQFEARGYFTTIDHPAAGPLRYPGAPLVTEGQWWRIHRPAPLHGQHTAEVLAEVGYSEDRIGALRQEGAI